MKTRKKVARINDIQNQRFFYSKPSISQEISQSYEAMFSSKRNSRSRMVLSKSKTIRENEGLHKTWLLDINKSALYSIEKQRILEENKSSNNLSRPQAIISPLKTKRDQVQAIKMSPRTLMNIKSKEILYKAYIKDLSLWTGKYSKIITKDEVSKILAKMKYLNSHNIENREIESNGKYAEYLFWLSKELLSNLKIILLWIESFYEIHK